MTKEFKVRNVSGNSDLEVEYHNKHTVAKIVAAVVGSIIGLIIAIAIINGVSGDSDPDGNKKADPAATVEDPSHPERKGDPTPKKEIPKPPAEADDLTSIKLDDRSAYGIDDVWVTYSVTNKSSKASDYYVTFDVEKADGTRVFNSEIYVSNLKPGKTEVGETYTINVTKADVAAGAKITNVEVERTEAVG